MSNLILKVLTGSRAYGLETPESDWDYHGVFITPTSELLVIGSKPKESIWKEGDEDFQSWELGHFLHLAIQCNPTVLETFVAPPIRTTLTRVTYGYQLRELFPYVLERKRVYDAFRGYAHNQRTKLFKKPDDPTQNQPTDRTWKFATQYLRVLIQGERLLRTGKFVLNMKEYGSREFNKKFLMAVKNGIYTLGFIVDSAQALEEDLETAYGESVLPEKSDLDTVNEFLLRVRKERWE